MKVTEDDGRGVIHSYMMQFSFLLRFRLAPGRLGTMAEEWGELQIPGMAPIRVRLGRDGRPLMSETRRHGLAPALVYAQESTHLYCNARASYCMVRSVITHPRHRRCPAASQPDGATT